MVRTIYVAPGEAPSGSSPNGSSSRDPPTAGTSTGCGFGNWPRKSGASCGTLPLTGPISPTGKWYLNRKKHGSQILYVTPDAAEDID